LENKKKNKIKWEIECLKILTDLEKKQPQECAHLKKWIEPRYNLEETDNQNKTVLLVVEDISNNYM